MGARPWKPLDSSVAAKTGWAQWLWIRAGLFAQHLFFCSSCGHPEACLSERSDWRRHSGRSTIKIHSRTWLQQYTPAHSLFLSHTRRGVCLHWVASSWRLTGPEVFFCRCLWFVFVSSHYSRDVACGFPPWLHMRNLREGSRSKLP